MLLRFPAAISFSVIVASRIFEVLTEESAKSSDNIVLSRIKVVLRLLSAMSSAKIVLSKIIEVLIEESAKSSDNKVLAKI